MPKQCKHTALGNALWIGPSIVIGWSELPGACVNCVETPSPFSSFLQGPFSEHPTFGHGVGQSFWWWNFWNILSRDSLLAPLVFSLKCQVNSFLFGWILIISDQTFIRLNFSSCVCLARVYLACLWRPLRYFNQALLLLACFKNIIKHLFSWLLLPTLGILFGIAKQAVNTKINTNKNVS